MLLVSAITTDAGVTTMTKHDFAGVDIEKHVAIEHYFELLPQS